MKRYYIAYGSNLNIKQMNFRCPNAKPVGTSVLENHTLTFRGSKSGYYLTVEPKIGGKVPVAVWEVTEADEAALDRYEGFPNFYYKDNFTLSVKPLNGGETKTLNCFAYIMESGSSLGLPTEHYLEICRQGYRDFGFDRRVLKRVYERCRRTLDARKKRKED